VREGDQVVVDLDEECVHGGDAPSFSRDTPEASDFSEVVFG